MDQQEYAWKWFEYHAGQRLTGFRFFLILLGALVLGCTTELKEENILIARLVAGFGVIITLAFLILEIRNTELVNIGQNSLRKFEAEAQPNDLSDKRLVGSANRLLFMRHKFWFRLIYGMCMAGFFIGAIWPGLLVPHRNDTVPSSANVPYINSEARTRIDQGGKPTTPGELNYVITKIADQYLIDKGGVRYAHINEVVGALECAKLELYRRLAAPYEDDKAKKEGEVYRSNK